MFFTGGDQSDQAVCYLGWADVAFGTVLVQGPHVSLTDGAKSSKMSWQKRCHGSQKLSGSSLAPRAPTFWDNMGLPVTLLLGKDNFRCSNIREQSDWGLLPSRLPVLVQGMVVIVHLGNQVHKKNGKWRQSNTKKNHN